MQLLRKRILNLHGLINNKYFSDKFLILKFLSSKLEQFIRVQKNYFFEFKFEFGKVTEFFRVRVQVRVSSPDY